MLYLAGIQEDSIVDGPGIRTAFYAQGCPHCCNGCHNPETWPFEGGTGMEPEQLMEIVRANPLCHGVTFSGGEPFAQPREFARLARMLRDEGYEVASYTGYTFEALYHPAKGCAPGPGGEAADAGGASGAACRSDGAAGGRDAGGARGAAEAEARQALLEELDVLIDGPFLQAQKSLELNFRGSRNQRILNVKKSLAEGRAVPETSDRWLGI